MRGGGAKGVFARLSVGEGEKLALFGGRVTPCCEEIGDWGIQIDDDFIIDGLSRYHTEPEDSHCFNHSCRPNAGIKGQILLVAMRNIEAGEEVVFDYAMCLYKGTDQPQYRFECLCGADNCRGFVTDEDWMIPELQRAYKGYFSWFLQEKIDGVETDRN
jgi:hypothetical protein